MHHPRETIYWLVNQLQLPRFPFEMIDEINDADEKWWHPVKAFPK